MYLDIIGSVHWFFQIEHNIMVETLQMKNLPLPQWNHARKSTKLRRLGYQPMALDVTMPWLESLEGLGGEKGQTDLKDVWYWFI